MALIRYALSFSLLLATWPGVDLRKAASSRSFALRFCLLQQVLVLPSCFASVGPNTTHRAENAAYVPLNVEAPALVRGWLAVDLKSFCHYMKTHWATFVRLSKFNV
eukprot:4787442-Pleurochrysis_carterae.AAC.4